MKLPKAAPTTMLPNLTFAAPYLVDMYDVTAIIVISSPPSLATIFCSCNSFIIYFDWKIWAAKRIEIHYLFVASCSFRCGYLRSWKHVIDRYPFSFSRIFGGGSGGGGGCCFRFICSLLSGCAYFLEPNQLFFCSATGGSALFLALLSGL
jgi:hypothetical protein